MRAARAAPDSSDQRSASLERSQTIKFSELDLPEPVRKGIEDAGFEECTPIQAQTLPYALDGRDIAGQAQTGTGKTAAFLIAIFTLLLRRDERRSGNTPCPRALVIAPTRELAIQIFEEALLLGKHCDFNMQAVYGGVDYGKQADLLRDGVDILIGTPGRLIDYFKQKIFTLKDTEVFVADEADRMFDMGFIDDLRYLVRRMPPPGERVSFLYSATLSYRVLELAYEHMHDVHRVAIDEEQVTAERVEQVVYHVGVHEKLSVLLGLIEKEKPSRALVFVNTRGGAAYLAQRLEAQGYRAGALIGDLDQRKRMKMLSGFKDDTIDILVATDVASRGLHIESVSHVFNYDLPQDPEDYVHRIGRTARAGASGKAISLACEHYVYSLEAIEEFIGMRIPHDFPEPGLAVEPKPFHPPPREKRGREPERKGGRGRSRRGAPEPRSGRERKSADADRKAEPSGAPAAGAEGGAEAGAEAVKKKRRRRRRKSGGPSENAAPTPAE